MSETKVKEEPKTTVAQDTLALVGCAGGIYAIYLMYGLLHERVYKTPRGEEGDLYEGFLTLVTSQSLVHSLVALVALAITRPKSSKVPMQDFAQIGFTYMAAMLASNVALGYVAYPTQVLAKACKMIPVMLMRIVLVGTKYSLKEYLAVGLITGGIAVFMLTKAGSKGADSQSSGFGYFLLALSLLMDGATGPKQDYVRETYKPSVYEMMLWINVFAVGFGLLGLVTLGELWTSLAFFEAHPDILPEILAFGVLSAFGQLIILITIFRFNSLVLTTVTTTRKFFTIMASVVYYGHTILPMQWLGVGIVFSGLVINIHHKYDKKKKKQALQAKRD